MKRPHFVKYNFVYCDRNLQKQPTYIYRMFILNVKKKEKVEKKL